MSERVTTEEIEKMILLYDKYGNYARVGREMGRAASTVSKYIKEYLVVHGKNADVVVAQNDAMAYGAWLAADSLRVKGVKFIGADGLEGADGGIDLVNRGILDSTIYCPTGGSQAVEFSMRVLAGEALGEKNLILEPEIIVSK